MLRHCLKVQFGLHRVMSTVTANSFIRDKAYVNGKWIDAEDGSTFEGDDWLLKCLYVNGC